MGRRIVSIVLSAALTATTVAFAQDSPTTGPGWRFGAGVGVYRIDDLAGTPVVPAGRLERAFGRQGLATFDFHYIHDAGFYGLDALAGDFGLGVRRSRSGGELGLVGGFSGILGGDGDGTPYVAGGVHVGAQGIAWLGSRVGFSLRGTGRFWISYTDNRFMPSVVAGVIVRL